MMPEGYEEKLGQVHGRVFSFVYDGVVVTNTTPGWSLSDKGSVVEPGKTVHQRVYTSPDRILEITHTLTEFAGNPAFEYILHVKNLTGEKTPIIENILPLDIEIPVKQGKAPSLLYSKGAYPEDGIDNYTLQNRSLGAGKPVLLKSNGGKTADAIPFFNIYQGDGGLIGAVGWQGMWFISAERQWGGTIRVKAGMQQTRISLLPGEMIRTPSILLYPWSGDLFDAHNALRRHVLKYHTPHYNGQPVTLPLSHGGWGGMKTKTAMKLMELFVTHKLEYDVFWMDSGWYGEDRIVAESQVIGEEDWYLHAGNWKVNKVAHPDGLKPISDAVHAIGMKYLLWFEPERVVRGTPISEEHPEWLMEGQEFEYWPNKKRPIVKNNMFNFGIKEAREWMTDIISQRIQEFSIDIFRQDFNDGGQKYYFEKADPDDRKGVTEIRYTEGILEFWDELRRRHPDLILDVAQRTDLETITRAVDLTRSDFPIAPDTDPIGNQAATLGLMFWKPHFGSCMTSEPGNTYSFHSSLCPGSALSIFSSVTIGVEKVFDISGYPFEWAGKMIGQYKRARPFFYCDYYPLTVCPPNNTIAGGSPWSYNEAVCSVDRSQWCAYQLHDSAGDGGGMVMAFRRQHSPFPVAIYKLRGLDAGAIYEFEDANTYDRFVLGGGILMEKGISIELDSAPLSKLLFYKVYNR